MTAATALSCHRQQHRQLALAVGVVVQRRAIHHALERIVQEMVVLNRAVPPPPQPTCTHDRMTTRTIRINWRASGTHVCAHPCAYGASPRSCCAYRTGRSSRTGSRAPTPTGASLPVWPAPCGARSWPTSRTAPHWKPHVQSWTIWRTQETSQVPSSRCSCASCAGGSCSSANSWRRYAVQSTTKRQSSQLLYSTRTRCNCKNRKFFTTVLAPNRIPV